MEHVEEGIGQPGISGQDGRHEVLAVVYLGQVGFILAELHSLALRTSKMRLYVMRRRGRDDLLHHVVIPLDKELAHRFRKDILGKPYDVIEEGDHIHIEYDLKKAGLDNKL